MTPYPPAEYQRYIELFNSGEYFEAHEILEDLWVMTPGEERGFYKGLIMLSVGLLHAERGNDTGARGVLTGALEHLMRYPDGYGNLGRDEPVALAQAVLAGARHPGKRPQLKPAS
jgi:predicted metal-dependent hydrolase